MRTNLKKLVATGLMITALASCFIAEAEWTGVAVKRTTAYTNSALTKKNGVEYVDAGDTITVLQEAGNAYYVRYPLAKGGYKERWVSKDVFGNVTNNTQSTGGIGAAIAKAVTQAGTSAIHKYASWEGVANKQATAYTNAALTTKNGVEWVGSGDTVTVLDESGNAYLVRYPLMNGGYKERWVAKSAINRPGAGTSIAQATAKAVTQAGTSAIHNYAAWEGVANKQATAYTNAALTTKNGVEWVGSGDTVTVLNESGNAYLVRYPLMNGGTKERWVAKSAINRPNSVSTTTASTSTAGDSRTAALAQAAAQQTATKSAAQSIARPATQTTTANTRTGNTGNTAQQATQRTTPAPSVTAVNTTVTPVSREGTAAANTSTANDSRTAALAQAAAQQEATNAAAQSVARPATETTTATSQNSSASNAALNARNAIQQASERMAAQRAVAQSITRPATETTTANSQNSSTNNAVLNASNAARQAAERMAAQRAQAEERFAAQRAQAAERMAVQRAQAQSIARPAAETTTTTAANSQNSSISNAALNAANAAQQAAERIAAQREQMQARLNTNTTSTTPHSNGIRETAAERIANQIKANQAGLQQIGREVTTSQSNIPITNNSPLVARKEKAQRYVTNIYKDEYRTTKIPNRWLEFGEEFTVLQVKGNVLYIEYYYGKNKEYTEKGWVESSVLEKQSFIWPVNSLRLNVLYYYSNEDLIKKMKTDKHSCRYKSDGKPLGVDIGGCKDFEVKAIADGTVITSEWCTTSAFGYLVEIRHDDDGKLKSLYAHLRDKPLVKVGQEVKQGTVIGIVGGTGDGDKKDENGNYLYSEGHRAFGEHLHFEMSWEHPYEYFRDQEQYKFDLQEAALKRSVWNG